MTEVQHSALDVTELLKASTEKNKALNVDKEIPVEIDLGLLAVFDPNPIEPESYSQDKEQTLLLNARDGIQLLVNQIWSQKTRIVDDGVVAELPPISTALPREKPLPKPKPMTKWQAFANAKGIAPKAQKDRMVFDEQSQEWVPRWGYKGKNKQLEDQWIVEVPANADPEFDPVKNSKDERAARKNKNETQRLKNLQRAAVTAATQQQDTASRLSEREQRKRAIERELKVTKQATASLGKFDPKLRGEPEREKGIKRKFPSSEVDVSSERASAMQILQKIGATPSNKRTKKSDDAPDAGKDVSAAALINDRKAIKKMSGGRGVMGLAGGDGKRGGRGGSRGGRGGGRGGRGK